MVQNIKISQLPIAGPILGGELLVCVQGGVTSLVTVSNLTGGLVGPAGPAGPPGPAGPAGPPGGANIDNGTTTTTGFGAVYCAFVNNPTAGPPGHVVPWPNMAMNLQGGFTFSDGTTTCKFFELGIPFFNANNAIYAMQFFDPAAGCLSLDGYGYNVCFCAPGLAITFTTATPLAWAGPAPIDVWKALDRVAAALTTLGVPP